MNILHLDKNHPLLTQQLKAAGHQNTEGYTLTRSEALKILPDFDGVVLRSRITVDQEFLDAGERLKFIARVGAGMESIDAAVAHEKGIQLFSAPEGNRNAVGEHALGMLLGLLNKLIPAHQQIKKGQWNREANRGLELDYRTVGIIGYGNMGKAFARKLRGFECRVLCYDILENVGDENARQVDLQTLQKEADVISLHTPWTPLTDKMVNAEFINGFTKPFFLINTARGKSVVTADLVSAIKSGKVLGAGLDVLEYEKSSFESLFEADKMPQALAELLEMDQVILSPHIAGWTVESLEKLAQTIVDKINNAFDN